MTIIVIKGATPMQNAKRAAKSKGTTDLGFENPNRQVVVRSTGRPGNGHNQMIYEMKCLECGDRYGVNGSDIFERKCPKCQDGACGLPIDPLLSSTTPWTVADAKARLSEVLEKARSEGPQTITRNGKKVAVVVGFEEWERRLQRKGSLAEFLYNSPLRGADIDLERIHEEPRDIEL
jgi:prevent-host-death family protein